MANENLKSGLVLTTDMSLAMQNYIFSVHVAQDLILSFGLKFNFICFEDRILITMKNSKGEPIEFFISYNDDFDSQKIYILSQYYGDE